MTSSSGYKATIGVLGTPPTVITGNLYNDGSGQDVSSVQIFVAGSGTQTFQYVYFNNFQIRDPAQTVTATSAVSRKKHNGSDFDVNLPLSGAGGIESRLGGQFNNYTVVLALSGPPDLAANAQAEVISGAGEVPNNGSVSVAGNTVTIPLANVVSQQAIQVRLNALNSAGGIVVPMRILAGDVNGDGSVNSADATITRNRSGQSTDAANFRADYNLDGAINSADATIVRARSGQFVPAAERAAAARLR
jgi:hypothetical protein